MKTPGNLSIAGRIVAGGMRRLLVAEHQHGRAFKRAALGERGGVGLAIFVRHVEREEMLRRFGLGLAGVRHIGNGAVRALDFLRFIDGVAAGILHFGQVLAVGVGNDGRKLCGGLVLDAERHAGFGQRIEGILAFRTALRRAFRHRDLRGAGKNRIDAGSAFGVGERTRRGGNRKGGGGQEGRTHHEIPFLLGHRFVAMV